MKKIIRIIRNLLITLLCISAAAAAIVSGYYQYRGKKEKDLLEQGLQLMEQGNYRLARESFVEGQQYENSITRRMSDDSLEEDLYKYVAICDFRLGEIDEAATIYDRLLRIHPRDPLLMEGRATVYAAQGKMKEAESLFATAAGIDKNNYEHLYTAALVLREYGNEKAAKGYFEKLLSDFGDSLDALTRGQSLCYLGRYQEAEKILEEVANPDMETSFMLASAKEYNGRHEEALTILAEYEEQIRTNPRMLDLKGAALCALGRYQEALRLFEEALPLAQEKTALHRSILFNRIAALENLRQFAKAKELAAQYSTLYPDDDRMNRENLFLQTR